MTTNDSEYVREMRHLFTVGKGLTTGNQCRDLSRDRN